MSRMRTLRRRLDDDAVARAKKAGEKRRYSATVHTHIWGPVKKGRLYSACTTCGVEATR
jgi:hypothetical protein